MNDFCEIRTVLGKKKISKSTVTLSHEHICCYSEYLNTMSAGYLNQAELTKKSVAVLKQMKEKYNLGLFIDCTPLNIGRNIPLLKNVSELSGVDIVCSTGFYYGDDPILNCMSAEALADYMVEDANNVCAGVIKAAVEYEEISEFNRKLLKASAIAQMKTGLPIVLHTNANNKNGLKAVDILLSENANAGKTVVGHLSDTKDTDYIKDFAKLGCYVAFDRIYENTNNDYINSKISQITDFCEAGYENKLLLSHDDAVFMGFNNNPQIKEPRWSFMFDNIIPRLDIKLSKKILEENPIAMLCNVQ